MVKGELECTYFLAIWVTDNAVLEESGGNGISKIQEVEQVVLVVCIDWI